MQNSKARTQNKKWENIFDLSLQIFYNLIQGEGICLLARPSAYERIGMSSSLSESSLLQLLEGVASQLEIEVRYESLDDEEFSVHSGGCRLLGRSLILIDIHRAPLERARVLARELSRHDLEDLYVLPAVRDFILLQSSPREKNLPQR